MDGWMDKLWFLHARCSTTLAWGGLLSLSFDHDGRRGSYIWWGFCLMFGTNGDINSGWFGLLLRDIGRLLAVLGSAVVDA